MKGLLLKDFYNVKNLISYYALVAAVFAVVSVVSSNIYFFCGFMIFISVGLVSSTISYDAQDKWDRYALSSGVSRRTAVLSKYVFTVVTILCSLALGLILALALGYRQAVDFLPVVAYSFAGVLSVGIVLPCFFRFGVEKARVIYMIVIVFTVALMVGGISLFERLNFAAQAPWMLVLLAVLSVAILAISYFVSLRIYRNKEFN
ncbi:ABC-2 transporter permease [Candidatus Borkfalkia ceftriaxoniphila]|uniref:ABC-2 transporter permease n=1 Tax=Candidatus Borkfalkia ceftriaxoniphila TaxID=2508949 RepID=A0A4Q2KH11_9FIRM|nr:ABC-2 transporter permease [Candidatus Borkfalkia ceftriaxoniphila]RXZ62403.1 ABC-2 transporter permease [Candidatus Borkfalkia ceftriaxoniphila]